MSLGKGDLSQKGAILRQIGAEMGHFAWGRGGESVFLGKEGTGDAQGGKGGAGPCALEGL